jgi:hypothetical protein
MSGNFSTGIICKTELEEPVNTVHFNGISKKLSKYKLTIPVRQSEFPILIYSSGTFISAFRMLLDLKSYRYPIYLYLSLAIGYN